MTIRTKTISILVTLATLWSGATDAVAAPSDRALQALKGQWVIVHTSSGRLHGGTFVHFDAKTLTIHVGDWKAVTLQRHLIAKVAKPSSPAGKKMSSRRRARHRRLRRVRTPEKKRSRAQLTARINKARVTFGWGVALLALGVAGTIGSVYGIQSAQKKARASDSGGSCSLDSSDEHSDCNPRFEIPGLGYGFLAVVTGSLAVAGLILTIQGASRWKRFSRTLERYRPQVNLDPVNKRYSVSMSLSF